jgi:transposase
MSSALSVDLRERVVRAVEAGASRHQAAERFGVSLASASRWCGQFARVTSTPSLWVGISARTGSRPIRI